GAVRLLLPLAARSVLLQPGPVEPDVARKSLEQLVGDPPGVLRPLVRVQGVDVLPELALLPRGEHVRERLLRARAEEREPGEAELHLPGPDVLVDDAGEAVLLVLAAD